MEERPVPNPSRHRLGHLVLILALTIVALAAVRAGSPPLELPTNPCPSPLEACLGGGKGAHMLPGIGARPSAPAPVAPSSLTVRIVHGALLRRFSPRALELGSVVTPRSLLLDVADRLGIPPERVGDWMHETTLLVDGHRWRPGGLFGYTKPAITRRWIRRVDVVQPPPLEGAAPSSTQAVQAATQAATPRGDATAAPPSPSAAKPDLVRTGPSVVDVLLHDIRVSGEASVTAGVVEGSGPGSGGNAEDYNILLDAHDRRGDALILDFNYLHTDIPFFPYAYGYLPPP